jgi:hypothetical protein
MSGRRRGPKNLLESPRAVPLGTCLLALCLPVGCANNAGVSKDGPDTETGTESDTASSAPEPSSCTAVHRNAFVPHVEWRTQCDASPLETPAPFDDAVIAFQQDDSRFEGDEIPSNVDEVFTAATADMDLDGDPDVMFNRHLLAPLEMFENVGGRFVQINPRFNDTSGIWENRGIPDLYADAATMIADIDATGAPGLYVWHDENHRGSWQIYGKGADLSLLVEVNRPLISLSGIDASLISQTDEYTAQVSLPANAELTVSNQLIGTQLKLTVTSQPAPTMYIGRTMVAVEGGFVSLWKNDWHGVAWVDAVGSPEPDLYVTRGGLTGLLLPPFEPKTDHFWEFKGGVPLYEQVPDAELGPDYCRGRQTAWFDVDNDGSNELYISCTATANRLLDDNGAGFVDRAPELNLDHVEPDAFAIFDVDGDACLDMVHNDLAALVVHLRDGGAFVENPGPSWGLISPVTPEDLPEGIWNPFALHVFDFDRDGDLDLWANNFKNSRVAVFRREGEVFVDATADVGLDAATGFVVLIPMDVDNDGWIDLVAGSMTSTMVWRNLSGVGFAPQEVGSGFINGVAADVDSDGQLDLITSTATVRSVFFNRTTGGGYAVRVDVDAPLGSLVRGYYEDGSTLIQQWGSADTSRYSQSLQPLRFGVGGVPLVAVGLQWPGELGERTRVSLAPGQTSLAL